MKPTTVGRIGVIVTLLMATYNMRRKRKLQTTSEKKRPEVEPSPRKRLRTKSSEPTSPLKSPFTNTDDDSPTFATKSFYGGRRKSSAASTSSSTTTSPVVLLSPLAERKLENIRVDLRKKRLSLSQTDSENGSPNSQASGYTTRVLRTREKPTNRKPSPVPGKGVKGKKKGIFVTKNAKGSLTPAPKKVDFEDSENTPVKFRAKSSAKTGGKKFFRTKSPASADKMVGSIVVRKGFNLKFVPKRLSGNLWTDTLKSKKDKKVKKTPKSKYPKLKMVSDGKRKESEDVFLWESEPSSGENTDSKFVLEQTKSKNVSKNKIKPKTPRPKGDKVYNSRVSVERCPVQDGNKHTKSLSDSKKRDEGFSGRDAMNQSITNSTSRSNKVFNTYVSVKKCDIEVDNRSADSACHVNTSPQSSPTTVSVVSEPVTKKTESYSGSQDLFGFDVLLTDDNDTSLMPSASSDVSMTPTKNSPSDISEEQRFFPIFDAKRQKKPESANSSPFVAPRSLRSSPRVSPGLNMMKISKETNGMEQMIIDAGQKKFGAVQCEVCNMLYNQGDPNDEGDHVKMHLAFVNALSFPGWKKERVVQEFPDTGSRVIMVLSQDPKYATKKVEDINRVMSKDLGFPEQSVWVKPHVKVFLYVNDEKEVEGCVVAESITEGYRVIPESQAGSQVISQRTGRPWCCQTEPEEALVGISRLWVYGRYRKKGVATRLVDTVRQVFEHGMMIDKSQIAFSDPTSDGKQFATKYSGTPAFLVYKYM